MKKLPVQFYQYEVKLLKNVLDDVQSAFTFLAPVYLSLIHMCRKWIADFRVFLIK